MCDGLDFFMQRAFIWRFSQRQVTMYSTPRAPVHGANNINTLNCGHLHHLFPSTAKFLVFVLPGYHLTRPCSRKKSCYQGGVQTATYSTPYIGVVLNPNKPTRYASQIIHADHFENHCLLSSPPLSKLRRLRRLFEMVFFPPHFCPVPSHAPVKVYNR